MNYEKKKMIYFFDIAQVDVNTENKIKELTKKSRFRIGQNLFFKTIF